MNESNCMWTNEHATQQLTVIAMHADDLYIGMFSHLISMWNPETCTFVKIASTQKLL